MANNSFGVRGKLILSNLVCFAMLFGWGWYNISASKETLKVAKSTKDASIIKFELVSYMTLAASQVQQWVTDGALVSLAGEASDSIDSLKEADDYATEFYDSIDKFLALENISSEEREALSLISKKMDKVREIGKEMVSAYGRSGSEGNRVMPIFDEASEATIESLKPLAKKERATMFGDMEGLIGLASGANDFNFVGLLFISAVMFVSGWVVARSIVGPISSVIDHLKSGAQELESASNQLSASGQALAQGASEQAASIEETTAAVAQISEMASNNSKSAQDANQITNKVQDTAQSGFTQMQEMVSAITNIKSAAEETADIIKTIDDIAFQTNLLALNAAVEAARAGDAGKGFAVVAEEVRSLAQRSATAAKDTADKIRRSTELAENGVRVSRDVERYLSEIQTSSKDAFEIVSRIASASKDQSSGLANLDSSMGELDRVTQTNAASAEESAAAAADLAKQTDSLKRVISDLTGLVYGAAQNGVGQTVAKSHLAKSNQRSAGAEKSSSLERSDYANF